MFNGNRVTVKQSSTIIITLVETLLNECVTRKLLSPDTKKHIVQTLKAEVVKLGWIDAN